MIRKYSSLFTAILTFQYVIMLIISDHLLHLLSLYRSLSRTFKINSRLCSFCLDTFFSQIKRKSSAGIVNNFDNNLTFRDLKAVVIFSLSKHGQDVYALFKIIENDKSIKCVPDNLNILFLLSIFTKTQCKMPKK